jgi:cytochrome P450 family 628
MFIPNLAEIQLAISLGLITHLCIFIHGELNSYATYIASSFIFAYLSIALFCYLHSACLLASLTKASILISSYLLALGGSILAYRIFFHRLGHFPGDQIDALTKWGAVAKAQRDGQYFLILKALHKKYGDFVRIGLSQHLHVSP